MIVGERIREQECPPPVDYLFAPLKHARLDYMAQKAVEMGARSLRPVITRRTQVGARQSRAARGQCARGLRAMRRDLAARKSPSREPLEAALARWPAERLLVFCDEDAPLANPLAALARRAGCAAPSAC